MTITKLGLGAANRNIDSISLTENLEFLQDCYQDESGSITRRWGRKLLVDLGTKTRVDGLTFWDNREEAYAVSNGNTYAIRDRYANSVDNLSGYKLRTGIPATFGYNVSGATEYLFIANGNIPGYTDGAANLQQLVSTGTHTIIENTTHLAVLDGILILNDVDNNQFRFSNPFLPFKFDAGDSYDAESSPDKLLALIVANHKMYLFGSDTTETWYNAGQPGDPFVRRLSSSFVENGVFAPYTIVVADLQGIKTPIFLDKRRRIIGLFGESSQEISQAYNRYINRLARTDNAFAFNIIADGKDLIAFTFPQENKTIVYDLDLNAWYQWGKFISGENYDEWDATSYVFAKAWNKHLVGSSDGKIYEISPDYYDDDDADLVGLVRTGWINYGDEMTPKRSAGLLLRLKRGVGKKTSTDADKYEEPFLLVRHRDNGNKAWSNWTKVGLGAIGDTEIRRWVYRGNGGVYFSRQYEIKMPDPTSVVIAGAWENIIRGRAAS